MGAWAAEAERLDERGIAMKQGLVSSLKAMAAAAAVAMAALALSGGSAGCSSSPKASGPTCDSSKCAAGNQCIDDGSTNPDGTPVGPTCHLVCTQQTDCPKDYYCNDGVVTNGQPANWCVANTYAIPAATDGLWGTPCLPSDGEGNNKACDTDEGFACYGISPTDANAFCTQFDCTADSDCPGGWWCETVDVKPNVLKADRSFNSTRTVCRPRQYCAPCQEDHDCPVAANGSAQRCVPDGSGGMLCSSECSGDANCALDASCATAYPVCTPAAGTACKSDDDCPPANGTFQHCVGGSCTPECGGPSDCASGQDCGAIKACIPRAATCLGDGSFCSPCRSDADCAAGGGVCVYADYSTERYCSVPMKSGTTCPPDTSGQGATLNAPPKGSCPSAPSGSPASQAHYGALGCSITATSLAPANECIALTSISDGQSPCGPPTYADCIPVPGCWTANRH